MPRRQADEFLLLDLREGRTAGQALTAATGAPFDEVYQLAADMGGMGFIHTRRVRDHAQQRPDQHPHDRRARREMGVPRYFFSSSVCVYRDMQPGEPEMTEAEAMPAHPDNEYGWEKLYAERMAQAYARHYPMQVRIARFQNCYGPEGTWTGGREKAPAAICRKVAEARGRRHHRGLGRRDGHPLLHLRGRHGGRHLSLMQSDLEGAVNIGCPEYVTVDELVETVAEVAGKRSTSSTSRGRWACSRATLATNASTRWAGKPGTLSETASPAPIPGLRIRSRRLASAGCRLLENERTRAVERYALGLDYGTESAAPCG